MCVYACVFLRGCVRIFVCACAVAISVENREKIVAEGVLDPLVLMARSDIIEVKREVAAALCCLSSVEGNKIEIAGEANVH
jgi:hypothetical protein